MVTKLMATTNFTDSQLQTLKAAILADPTAAAAKAAGDTYTLLQWLNGVTTTSAWRTRVGGAEIYDAHKPVEYINRSVAERSAFDLMSEPIRNHDFTNLAKRNGVADIFSGATNNTSRTAIFTIAQEFATNAQLAFGGTTVSVGGTTAMSETVSALKRTFTGKCDQMDANVLVSI